MNPLHIRFDAFIILFELLATCWLCSTQSSLVTRLLPLSGCRRTRETCSAIRETAFFSGKLLHCCRGKLLFFYVKNRLVVAVVHAKPRLMPHYEYCEEPYKHLFLRTILLLLQNVQHIGSFRCGVHKFNTNLLLTVTD